MAAPTADSPLTLFLCGDVMLGRGVDQVLPHPSGAELHEEYVRSALTYVDIAERAHGSIPARVDFAYVWGDALAELSRTPPDARIVNLETAVTTSGAWEPKGINYRMHPRNVPSLTAAGVDCCVLANNHVLDWGAAGLEETLATLDAAGVRHAGAGRAEEAARPAVLETRAGRVLVFAFASECSGVSATWAATAERPGVSLLRSLRAREAERVARAVGEHRRPGDVTVVSLHWGGNWGYAVPAAQRRFAHRLVDSGVVDVVHGHSSHHPKALEVHRGRLILYGCGDFLNDYEGISGHDEYRDDLVLMYFVSLRPGALIGLRMVPLRIRRFRLERATQEDARWLRETLDRESASFGTRVVEAGDGSLAASWA